VKKITSSIVIALIALSIFSCKKDGLNSPTAKKIQYKWERTSVSLATDYRNGLPVTWGTQQIAPGTSFLEIKSDGYMYANSTKYQYKVDGDKLLSVLAGNERFTTPQYTDTAIVKEVSDHLLVLSSRTIYVSGAYSYEKLYLDSLKR
jgi:hypothetical protein